MQNYEDLNDRLKRLNLDITFNDFDAWEKYPEYKSYMRKVGRFLPLKGAYKGSK